jgi:hypothetical protein
MSVDFPAPGFPTAVNARSVRDLFVIIGGYGAEDSSSPTKPLPATPAYSGAGDLLERVQKLIPSPGHQNKVIGLKGTLIDSDVGAGFDFIKSNFHPLGKLIIYGTSMGGAAALALCRKIDIEGPYYSEYSGLTTSRVSAERTPKIWNSLNIPAPSVAGSNPLNMPTRVDLLITVDAARGPTSASLDRTVGKCVRTNLNYYQTTPHGLEKSFGGPNAALDPSKTVVWNHDLTGRIIPDPDPARPPHAPTHITIDEQTNNVAMAAIKKALKVTQLKDFMDVT